MTQRAESLVETLAFGAMRELLQAILTPQKESSLKIALAGPLLGWSQAEVLALADSQTSRMEELISQGMALRRIWRDNGFSAFYQAFLASSWSGLEKTVGENLLMREGGLDLFHGIQQIAEFLIEKEISEKLPPYRLLRTLDELLQVEEEGDQNLKQRINPEKEGVRILTIHSSKGLEFEIVFALGVVKRPKRPSPFVPITSDHLPPLLTPLEDESDPRYVEYLLEIDAEKIRQLYVAFTRAKQRLYIPLFLEAPGKLCQPGAASAMELYLALLGQPQIPFEDLHERIQHLKVETSLEEIRQLANKCHISEMTFSAFDEVHESDKISSPFLEENQQDDLELRDPPKIEIPGEPLYMHSFTALTKGSSSTSPSFEEVRPPSDFDCSNKNPHTLPAGSSTGTLLHTLLEKIPFYFVSEGKRNNALLTFVDRYIYKTPFKAWLEVISDILYHALTTPLLVGNGSFYLQNLAEDQCYREHEFLYPTTHLLHPEFEMRPGFLKGVIDLVFECNGKFCIVDWKSNWLGPDESHYSLQEIDQAMQSHDYYLQANIYKEALKRYLKLVDERPFEEIFGGVFYVFLRGCGSSLQIF